MKQRGYSVSEIARKTGLSPEFVYGVSRLLERGEQRLLRSVESGQIPISVAVAIAEADDQGIQQALQRRSEEHTSELQSTNAHLVCHLLFDKQTTYYILITTYLPT